jgi:hypothetical protein
MDFETFEMPENKRIIVTDRKSRLPVIRVNSRTFSLIPILNGSFADMIEPKPMIAYSIQPRQSLNFDSAWQFGGLMYKICGSKNLSVALISPEVIKEIGNKGYTESDKLRQFTHYDTPQMFERAVGF